MNRRKYKIIFFMVEILAFGRREDKGAVLKFFILPVFLITSLCFGGSQNVSRGVHDLALRLAIEAYNSDHSKPLASYSNEHRKMLTLLGQVFSKYPELKELPHYPSEDRYRVLQYVSRDEHSFEDFFRDRFPYDEEVIKRRSTKAASRLIDNEINKTYFVEKLLGSLEIGRVEFKALSIGGQLFYQVNIHSRVDQDLEYVKKQLINGEYGIAELGQVVSPRPLSRQYNYYENQIRLKGVKGASIQVDFVDRWERFGNKYVFGKTISGTYNEQTKQWDSLEVVGQWGKPRPKMHD